MNAIEVLITYYAGFVDYIGQLKNLYGKFWRSSEGYYFYYLKFDGYFYCKKEKCLIAVIRIRHKRQVELHSIKKIVNDLNYIKELHPEDASALGLLANLERNNTIKLDNIHSINNMVRIKDYSCAIKSEPILNIIGKDFDDDGDETIILYSNFLKNEIKIKPIDLFKNSALTYAIGSLESITVGCSASQSQLTKPMDEQ